MNAVATYFAWKPAKNICIRPFSALEILICGYVLGSHVFSGIYQDAHNPFRAKGSLNEMVQVEFKELRKLLNGNTPMSRKITSMHC